MAKVLQKLSDQQLLQALQEDEKGVFNVLFDRYFHRLHGFGFSLLNDSETAKELAMDVMFRLWQKRKDIHLQEDQTLVPYLFRSIKNAVLNHLRKARILTQPLDTLLDEATDLALSADSRFNHHELAALYEDALRKMPEQRRKIFLLNREENLSYSEIAERLNLSIHTVRNQISSSLQYFHKHLGAYDETAILLLIAVLL
ncbi:RNA polymerase sigma-70 factor, ECF subfamily [Parapedobacter composti]|uniref:RNA polymerase sigma-70 factor, ECF subfamily n=1 Tax=Parapedobacter composti TaxID=623281 RepID=A0A1I1L6W6_9SPHI|nr:RNA polymerase sigma-70 factor [Parapedobacter composti]SFC68804.1 RNA polymerase sigma-70 factor, ECF subfamily [Parapedobacter composti]